MSARWWTLFVWALAAAGGLFWGLKLFVKAPAAPPHTQLAQASEAARGDVTRLLGADPVAPAPALAAEPQPDARFQLIGVLSPRSSQATREGVALIAVDGNTPRAYRVGTVVDGQNILQSVNARGAMLGPRDGAALVALTLPPPAPPATGVPGSTAVPVRGAGMPQLPGMPPPGVPARQAGFPPPPQPGAATTLQRRAPAPATQLQSQSLPPPQVVDPTPPPPGAVPSQPIDAAEQR